MGGLAVLFFIGLYIGGAIWLVHSRKTRRAKWIAAAIALLLPTTDAVLGRLYLKHLCNTEGGLKVYRVVKGVKGFMWDLSVNDEWIKKYGFHFVEGNTRSDGMVNRHTLKNGKIISEWPIASIARYKAEFHHDKSGSYFEKQKYEVLNLDNKEVLSTYTHFGFRGGWAEQFLAQFSDAGRGWVSSCSRPRSNPMDIVIKATLKPAGHH